MKKRRWTRVLGSREQQGREFSGFSLGAVDPRLDLGEVSDLAMWILTSLTFETEDQERGHLTAGKCTVSFNSGVSTPVKQEGTWRAHSESKVGWGS